MNLCLVEGCPRTVAKTGHALCLDHWRADRDGVLHRCLACGKLLDPRAAKPHLCPRAATAPTPPAPTPADDEESPHGYLSSTKLGRLFGLSSVKMNLILAELGWIERYVKGWVPTSHGNGMGANVKEMRNGTPYVVWPDIIVMSGALRASIKEQGGRDRAVPPSPSPSVAAPVAPPPFPKAPPVPAPPAAQPPSPAPDRSADFRARFPATHRTQDGHMVRSRAEVLIDNWLYMQGIVHAYERRLPIEAECYCDFYVPNTRSNGGKGVYIEFWGRENDPKYRDRMAAKQAIYAANHLRLIELGDAEIERLDDVLPRLLLRFGIESA